MLVLLILKHVFQLLFSPGNFTVKCYIKEHSLKCLTICLGLEKDAEGLMFLHFDYLPNNSFDFSFS